jgi:hypothetical protein
MTKRNSTTPWNEARIAQALVGSVFKNAVLAIPNCNWTGNECDLLVIEKKNLRIIDVEIKVSRADLKADASKAKWWHTRPWSRRRTTDSPRQWPAKVWKHYYVIPSAIWDAKLLLDINVNSGVITVDSDHKLNVIRAAKPNKQAKPITSADAIDLARLASLRMWASFNKPNL